VDAFILLIDNLTNVNQTFLLFYHMFDVLCLFSVAYVRVLLDTLGAHCVVS
jgi:hypothetical protein